MANPANALRLNAIELLRSPGSTRAIDIDLAPAALDIHHEHIDGDLAIAVAATSGIDGIAVHGTVSTAWHAECRRCLIAVNGVAVSEIDERFQVTPSDADSLAIDGDQVDLGPVVREYVLLDVPEAPLCRPDCAGICAVCGADRNLGGCACDDAPRDLRWSALEGLTLADPDEPDDQASGAE